MTFLLRNLNDREAKRSAVAKASDSEIYSGMLIGLGTGRIAAYAIREIGRRIVEDSLNIQVVVTSLATEALAKSVGIDVLPFENISAVDLTIDGADELDSKLRAIKGGGGARHSIFYRPRESNLRRGFWFNHRSGASVR